MSETLQLINSSNLGNFVWGIKFSKDITNPADKVDIRQTFLEKSISSMVSEFESYSIANEEVPWWFNERALLGFFISGLVRNTKNVILQEYSCFRGTSKHNGRADLLVQYFDSADSTGILLESKYSECTAFCEEEGWDVRWEKDALKQAGEYAQNEQRIDYIGSLCFLPVCYECTREKEFRGIFDNWLSLSDFPAHEGYFYCIIKLENESGNIIFRDQKDEYAYPFLRISGILWPFRKLIS